MKAFVVFVLHNMTSYMGFSQSSIHLGIESQIF